MTCYEEEPSMARRVDAVGAAGWGIDAMREELVLDQPDPLGARDLLPLLPLAGEPPPVPRVYVELPPIRISVYYAVIKV